MENFLELVKNRRSVRKYLDQPIEAQKLELCLKAAQLAPSACNGQPWRFIVVKEPKAKQELAQAAFSGLFSSNFFAAKAPVLIVALVKKANLLPRIAGKLQDKHYPLIDLGIACEHLVLQAAELGLGTCWLGWFNQKAVAKILPCPSGTKPLIMISLGYPASPGKKRSKRLKLENIVQTHPQTDHSSR